MFIFYTFVFIHSFFIILFFIRSFFIPYFVYIYFLNVHFLYFYFLYSSFFMLFIFYKSKLLLQPSIKKIIFIHKIWPITQHMRLITQPNRAKINQQPSLTSPDKHNLISELNEQMRPITSISDPYSLNPDLDPDPAKNLNPDLDPDPGNFFSPTKKFA